MVLHRLLALLTICSRLSDVRVRPAVGVRVGVDVRVRAGVRARVAVRWFEP